MNDFNLFPASRLDRDFPAWVWFAGVSSIAGSIISGSLVLYLISINFSIVIICFYLLMAFLLPICGHGVLNLRKWAKSLSTVAAASILVITVASGVYKFAFATVPSAPGKVDMMITYAWLVTNAYVLIRLLIDRGERSPFNASNPPVETDPGKRPLYYYAFLVLWYGVILIALMDHLGVLSLPLGSA